MMSNNNYVRCICILYTYIHVITTEHKAFKFYDANFLNQYKFKSCL